MADWKGTVVPNTGYVEKVYVNTSLSVEEVVSLLSQLTYIEDNPVGVPAVPILCGGYYMGDSMILCVDMGGVYIIGDFGTNEFYFMSQLIQEEGAPTFEGWNPDFNGIIELNTELESSLQGFEFGTQNDKLTSLFSTTPFTQSSETIADKLQTLVNGKQYVVDKTNAKAETSLPINCTWEELGDTIEGIESGIDTSDATAVSGDIRLGKTAYVGTGKISGTIEDYDGAYEGDGESVLNSLKKLLDYTKSCKYMFYGKDIKDMTEYIKYSDTENVTNMNNMFSSCSSLVAIPEMNTSNVTDMASMFSKCSSLAAIPEMNTSNVTIIGSMFNGCNKLISLPQLNTNKLSSMSNLFYECFLLKKVDLTHYNLSDTNASERMFYRCYSLKAVIIRSFGASYTLNSNAFTNCYHLTGTVNATYNPNGDKDCYIYVPRSMVETLKSATNWSTYADQIRALEDYTIDGTTTGELDESKVNA